jgi:nucleoside-diphosphate-sugar epimerase
MWRYKPLKMREYTEMLIKESGLENVKMEINEKLWRPIDIQYQDSDASLINSELGWEPKIEIENTIKNTIKDLLFFWYNKLK